MTMSVAIPAAKGPPEVWRQEVAHLVRQKKANFRKEVISQAKKMRVGSRRFKSHHQQSVTPQNIP